MLLDFGKKKRRTRKSKRVPSKKLYAIKKKRIVQVVAKRTKSGSIISVYKSTRRAVPSTVRLFSKKSLARKHLKSAFGASSFGKKRRTKRRRVSLFGRKRRTAKKCSDFGKKRRRRMSFGAPKKLKYTMKYGYTACHNLKDHIVDKYKVYKFFPITIDRYTKLRIVVFRQDKYSPPTIMKLTDKAVGYVVTGKTPAQRKASEKKAKYKASLLAKKYSVLKLAGHGDLIVACDGKEIAAVMQNMPDIRANLLSGNKSFKLADPATQAKNNADIASSMENLRRMGKGGDYNGKYTNLGGVQRFPGTPGYTKVYDDTTRRWTNRNQFGSSLDALSRFGRRVNYGFSQYF